MVSSVALAHNERDPVTGTPKAKIIHNLGRADTIDKEALARLVRSISRFLDPSGAVAASASDGQEIEILNSRAMGPAWVADRVGAENPIRPAQATMRLVDETAQAVGSS